MKSTQYTEKTLEHFRNPRNVGTLEGPNVAVGRVGNPVCGDMMDIYIEVVGRPHQGHQVPDVRLRLGRRDLEHDHRARHGHDSSTTRSR